MAVQPTRPLKPAQIVVPPEEVAVEEEQEVVQEGMQLEPRRTTALALPAEWQKELADEAKDAAAAETPSITNVSFRAGLLTVGGNQMPDNTMTMIAIGTALERSLYDGPYDPNNVKSPVCFALSKITTRDEVEPGVPHENSLYPQHPTCKGCPMDAWKSAGEGRKGKACKEYRRIALIPADKLESVDDILTSEMALAKIPVTSIGNWSNYVNRVAAIYKVPFWAVITRMTTRPHVKNQFEVLFDMADGIEDGDALGALKQKREVVESFVMAPYSVAQEASPEDNAPATPAGARPTIKGAPIQEPTARTAALLKPAIKKF